MNAALRDISEIDAIGWWPLAPGWWLIIVGIGSVLLALKWYWPLLVSWLKHPRDLWRRDARKQLLALRQRLDQTDQKSAATELSELIRRVALVRCGREACAGLSGEAWTRWLAANDPQSFDWFEHGGLLLKLAYAPPGGQESQPQIERMIDAAIMWTEAPACTGKKNG